MKNCESNPWADLDLNGVGIGEEPLEAILQIAPLLHRKRE